MRKKTSKEPTTSLLDSVFYQSALRVNRLEDNRLKKLQLQIKNDFEKQYTNYDNHSRNSYDWVIEMRKNSGRKFPVNPSKIKVKQNRPRTVPELRPTCCVLYGTIIGERPVLLKNFLGRRENKSKTVQLEEGEDKPMTAKIRDEMTIMNPADGKASRILLRSPESRASGRDDQDCMKRPNNDSPRDPTTGEIFKTFMFENKLVTQVPIGYTKSSSRPRTCFTSHTSEMLRPENTRTPGYYKLSSCLFFVDASRIFPVVTILHSCGTRCIKKDSNSRRRALSTSTPPSLPWVALFLQRK